MFGGVSARLRVGGIVGVIVLAFAVAASGAGAAKPHSLTGPAPLGGSSAPQAGLAVSSLSAAPADAAAGESFDVSGEVVNSSGSDLSGDVTLRLLMRGQEPRVVGSAAVRVAAGSTGSYEATVAVPADLPDGSYALAACTPIAGEGLLSCATARRGVTIGAPSAKGGAASTAAVGPSTNAAVDPGVCSPGAHTLSKPGGHVYPEMGNGGYASVHTDVNLIYDAVGNELLPGTNVVLSDRATQCLSDFSLDFERKGPKNPEGPGPEMQVEGVTVNGVAANFKFVQPTYPGDPNGQDDPNPLAHVAGLEREVSKTNPLPPACAPNLRKGPAKEAGEAAIGEGCPANKLVVTPAQPIANGEPFNVEVRYSGTPGVHTDGDGSAEGWFLSDEPAGDGSFVTTEPVGTEAWMPLNNHPSAKPTYDFNETVTLGRTAIANGELVGFSSNPPDATFPGGSTTWHWHSPEPIASYLVESSVGAYDLSERLGGDGVLYYEAQASGLEGEQKTKNKAIMDTQEEIVAFQERFAGPFPFTTDGVVIGATEASFEEEMQGKITFVGGRIGVSVFNHENMHQWFGDNVSEGGYEMTFYKEGLAQLSEYLLEAKEAAIEAGGLDTPAGEAAFEATLIAKFDANYEEGGEGAEGGEFWEGAPSDPNAATLFSGSSTYERPGTAYIALRQILGADNFAGALTQLGEEFGGSSIEEPQLEAVLTSWLPNQSDTCRARLGTFFSEWFDTSYPGGEAPTEKPQLTGPGLVASAGGTTFYDASGSCVRSAPVTTARLDGQQVDGAYTDPTVTVTATPGPSGAAVTGTTYSLDGGAPTRYTGPFTITGTGSHTLTYFSTDAAGGVERTNTKEVQVIDAPVTTATILPASSDGKVVTPATVVLTAKGDGSGIKATEYALDGGPLRAYGGPITVGALGVHTLDYRSVAGSGATEATKHLSFTVVAPPKEGKPPVCAKPRLTARLVHPLRSKHGVAILRRGKAYRYVGRLSCGGKQAPKGTVVSIAIKSKGKSSQRPGVAVNGAGKFDTLLRLGGRKTVVFSFAEGSESARAKVRIATASRR
jgi:hypothetical protein